jgi:hypothetical protein
VFLYFGEMAILSFLSFLFFFSGKKKRREKKRQNREKHYKNLVFPVKPKHEREGGKRKAKGRVGKSSNERW